MSKFLYIFYAVMFVLIFTMTNTSCHKDPVAPPVEEQKQQVVEWDDHNSINM